MKTDSVFKNAYNHVLGIWPEIGVGQPLPPESELRRRIGVSRTTVRKVIVELTRNALVTGDGAARVLARSVEAGDYFPDSETMPRNTRIEQQFMDWMLRGDAKPGTLINELDLSRQFGVATSGIREFLIRFSRFGLIEKRPNSGWLFKGFTEAFALELFEIRVLFERRSARLFAALPDSSPLWEQLEAVKAAHLTLADEIADRYHDFSGLDERFHRLLNMVRPNRFVDNFYDIISVIFHYHYQWNKDDEKQRNAVALQEHLDYIDALLSRDPDEAEKYCLIHLHSAEETLKRSLIRFQS